MMKPLLLTLALLAGDALLPATAHAAESAAIHSNLMIQVPDRDKAAAMLIGKTEALGGYFSSFTNDNVTLKVPADKSRELISYVKSQWLPVQEDYRAEDLASLLVQSRAQLKAKLELYASMEKLLLAANTADIVTIEAAATQQIVEIEGLKGRLRALQQRMDFSTVTVSFTVLQRERPLESGASPFEWLNAVGMEKLLQRFEQ